MPRFRVLVLGRGVRTEVDGEPRLLGFYVTRAIDADAISDAADVARERVADELSDRFPAENLYGLTLEIEEVERSEEAGNTGFAWFEGGGSDA